MNLSDNSEVPEFAACPEQLPQQFEALAQMIAKYLSTMPSGSVRPSLQPGDLAAQFDENAPAEPISLEALFRDIESKVLPGLTHWQHPKFFAYYPATNSLPAIVGDTIIAAIGAVGLQWSANPIATELECVVMDWFVKMLGAADNSPFLHTSGQGGGVLQNTAGESLVVVMTAARVATQQLRFPALELEALYYQDASSLVVYMSDDTHFSGPKAARVAGMRVHTIPSQLLPNGNYGITSAQVKEAMERDRRANLTPCLVQLNYGTTNTCGYDDLASFAGFSEQESVWLHVDAAYAGPALTLPEYALPAKQLLAAATSFNFNGSKWFLCGFDSAFLYVRDRQRLLQVFSASGDYMADGERPQIYNPEFKDWAVPLGRRFRALRIWLVICYFGVSGLRAFLRRGIEQADWLREKINESKIFELLVKTDLGLVCIRGKESDRFNLFLKRLEREYGEGGSALLYPSEMKGETFLRIALGGSQTQIEDVEELWIGLNRVYAEVATEA